MTMYDLMGLISTIALLLPIAILVIFRLAWYRSFPALLTYYILLFSCNLFLLNYIKANDTTKFLQESIHNLIEAPLLLLFLTYFSRSHAFKKKMLISLFALIAFEVVIVAIFGFTLRAFSILAAPGLLLVLSFSSLFFIHQVKLTIVYQKATGKALIISSTLFATIGFSFLYGVRYFANPIYQQDANLILFLITLFSSISMCIGLFIEQKRVRHLEELKTTREELKEIYGEGQEKATPPFGAVALNFDKEQWN